LKIKITNFEFIFIAKKPWCKTSFTPTNILLNEANDIAQHKIVQSLMMANEIKKYF